MKFIFRHGHTTLLLLVIAVIWPLSSGNASNRCADIFPRAIADGTRSAVDANFPVAGVYRRPDGRYGLMLDDQTHTSSSVTGLANKLASTMQLAQNNSAPMSVYFNNMSPDEAWNFIGTLRLKSADTSVDGIVGGGTGGGGRPPGNGHGSVAGGDEPPSGRHGGTGGSGGNGGNEGSSSGGGHSEPLRAAAFRSALKRYDWTKAAIVPIDQPPPFNDASPRWAFQINVPTASLERAGFKFWVLFPGRSSAPDVTAVGATVAATLKEKQLQQAAVLEAAKRLRTRVASAYPGSRSALKADLVDLTIVEIEPVGAPPSDG